METTNENIRQLLEMLDNPDAYTEQQIQDIITRHNMHAQVLAASFKNSQQVLSLCAYGIGAVTCAPSVIDSFVRNLAIDGADLDFVHDFGKLVGGGKTMADVIRDL